MKSWNRVERGGDGERKFALLGIEVESFRYLLRKS